MNTELEKKMERNACGLISSIILAFVLRAWGKSRDIPEYPVSGPRSETRTIIFSKITVKKLISLPSIRLPFN
jgi:hypothetical protein